MKRREFVKSTLGLGGLAMFGGMTLSAIRNPPDFSANATLLAPNDRVTFRFEKPGTDYYLYGHMDFMTFERLRTHYEDRGYKLIYVKSVDE